MVAFLAALFESVVVLRIVTAVLFYKSSEVHAKLMHELHLDKFHEVVEALELGNYDEALHGGCGGRPQSCSSANDCWLYCKVKSALSTEEESVFSSWWVCRLNFWSGIDEPEIYY